jgi:membrane dipeptidase
MVSLSASELFFVLLIGGLMPFGLSLSILPSPWRKRLGWGVAGLVVAATAFFFLILPGVVDRHMNRVRQTGPYSLQPATAALHQRLLIADLHADSLLWQRDLLQHQPHGQVDLPRLEAGNIALQMFTIVTKTPRNRNIDSNDDTTDNLTLKAVAERWPIKSWGSLSERTLYQAKKLADFAAASQGRLSLIRNRADLAAFLQRRTREPGIAAAMLGVEGAHALDGKLENLDRLYDAGIRMMAPTHFFDNDIAGSAHGRNKTGLTEKGRAMIRRMEQKHILLDLAHASDQTITDALAMSTRPVLVSHTGVKGTCNNRRNLSDAQLRAIAAKGGVIGIGFWDDAVCGKDVAAIARAIIYTIGVVGVQHVALGSDFDGAVTVPFDAAGLGLLTGALQQQGMSESDIALVMGGNVFRLLSTNLPN